MASFGPIDNIISLQIIWLIWQRFLKCYFRLINGNYDKKILKTLVNSWPYFQIKTLIKMLFSNNYRVIKFPMVFHNCLEIVFICVLHISPSHVSFSVGQGKTSFPLITIMPLYRSDIHLFFFSFIMATKCSNNQINNIKIADVKRVLDQDQ